MENKRKKSSVDDSVSVKDKKLSPKMTFDAFFDKCVRGGKLRHWQKKEIAAFFNDMKLTDKEDLDTFKATLEKY